MKTFVEYPDILHADRQLAFTETFLTIGTSSRGVITAAGTATGLNVNGGGIAIPTAAATDNSKSGWKPIGNIVTLGAGKTAWMGAKLQYTEANTNSANLLVGFISTVIGSALQNDGAGPPSSYSGAVFFKTDGGSANWSVEVSLAGTQSTAELSASNTIDKLAKPAAGSAYQYLEVLIMPKNATYADVIFKIDGVTVFKVMDWVITSVAAMSPIAMIMSGSTTPETINLRRVDFAQVI